MTLATSKPRIVPPPAPRSMANAAHRRAGIRGTPYRGVSLVDMLGHRARHQADEMAYTFLRDGEVETAATTWGGLAARSRAIAAAVQRGTAPGARAMLVFAPGLEFIGAFFGCLYAGVIPVPAQRPVGGRAEAGLNRLRAIAEDSGATLWLSTSDVLTRLRPLVTGTSDVTREPAWLATDTVADELARAWQPRQSGLDTIAFLQYTSGSTAQPKGVVVNHGNLLHNLAAAFTRGDTGPDTVSVSWLPVTHDMGLVDGVLQPAFSGCPAYLMSPGAFLQRPLRWLQAISRYRATRSGAPNFAYDLAVDRTTPADRSTLDLRPWRTAYNGAEPVRADTLARFAETFGPCGFEPEAFRPCYGLAESTLLVSAGRWQQADRTAGRADGGESSTSIACGAPADGMRVVIVDPASDWPLADGEPGEIRVSGPSVAGGYWRQPEETRRVFESRVDEHEGTWLRTGDLGLLRDGQLVVSGRLKDLLIVRGVKHFPQDLEHTVMTAHPAVRAGGVAAIAVSTSARGDRVVVIAELQAGKEAAAGQEAIDAVQRAIIERHGIQLHGIALVSVGTLPKTPSGKQQRFLCRDAWRKGTLRPLALWRADDEPGARAGDGA